jgi:uncharacterized membrane protein YjfL (UPF0719 family)
VTAIVFDRVLTTQGDRMNIAASDFGAFSPDKLLHGVVATLLYFAVGVVVLLVGFLMIDILTPGSLRREVFVDRRPNAVVIASATFAAIATVIVAAILTSSDELAQGLLDVVVYGVIGVVLQAIALILLDAVVPGRRLQDHIEDPGLHPAVFATATILLTVGAITAASLT